MEVNDLHKADIRFVDTVSTTDNAVKVKAVYGAEEVRVLMCMLICTTICTTICNLYLLTLLTHSTTHPPYINITRHTGHYVRTPLRHR